MNRAQRRAAARKAKRCTVCQAQVREERLRRHMLRHGIDIDAAEKADALAHLSQAQVDAGMDRLVTAIDEVAL